MVIEIKKFSMSGIEEAVRESLDYYMFNETEAALIHFLEQELERGALPVECGNELFVNRIVTDQNESRYLLTNFEGYVARRLD